MAAEDIYIVGVGMTQFGRHMDKSVKQLTAWAVEDALKDAGCDRKDIGVAAFGNTGQGHFDGQHMIRGQVALLPLGIEGIPIFNVEAADRDRVESLLGKQGLGDIDQQCTKLQGFISGPASAL